jgi:hypothetical protein
MEPDQTPTLEELEILRYKLVQDLKDAQLLGTEGNVHELITGKAALTIIDRMLREARKTRTGGLNTSFVSSVSDINIMTPKRATI